VVTGAGDGRRRAAADGSRARAESRDETRTRERVRRAGGERSSEWLGFGGGRRVVFYMGRGRRRSWAGPRAARLRLVLRVGRGRG